MADEARRLRRAQRFAPLLIPAIILAVASCSRPAPGATMYFTGKEAALEAAILKDDAAGVAAALAAGANPNQRGTQDVTPLEFAVGQSKRNAAAALAKAGGDPNLKDKEGDTAVTLAVQAYARDPQLLDIVLGAGGNPNTKRPDNSPVIVRFINDRNEAGLRRLKAAGANLDARDRSEDPLIVAAALTQDWDVVWWLIELGAKFDYRGERYDVAGCFRNARAIPHDSPIWPYKEKVWKHLRDHGIAVPPLEPAPKP